MEIFNEIIKYENKCKIKTAIFDFDGTISTLRCGWESIMEPLMLEYLSPNKAPTEELIELSRNYIDESTGIQTIFQMEWLSNKVSELNGTQPVDPWIYKDEYNRRLLQMVRDRIDLLAKGKANPADYLVNGSKEFLQYLSDNGIDIYIASGTDDIDLQNEVKLLGILPFVKKCKGAPHRQKDCSKEAVINEILQTQNLSGHELMVVGDGKVEIMLGNEVNALTIGVASNEVEKVGINMKKFEKLKKANANYIIGDFDCIKNGCATLKEFF